MRSLTTLLSPLLLLLLAAQAKAFDLKGVAIGDPWESTTIQKKLRIKLRAGELGPRWCLRPLLAALRASHPSRELLERH